jgi:tetratricopeptide (TPR) repeat protein
VDTKFANDLAFYLLMNNKSAEAAVLYKEVVEKMDRESAQTHEMLANAYFHLGEEKKALAELEKALALLPESKRHQRQVRLLRESTEAKNKPPVVLAPENLRRLAGDYEDRQVVLRDGSLYYTSPAFAESRLVPVTAESFAVEGRPTERLRFVTKDGSSTALVSTFLFGGEKELKRGR